LPKAVVVFEIEGFYNLKMITMRKIIYLLLIAVVISTTGCNRKEIARLKAKNDSLMMAGSSKDANLVEFVDAFNSIQSNLDSIKQKEKIIDNTAKGGFEVKGDRKEQIQSDINYIYTLLQKNRLLVADLSAKLKKSNRHVAELEKMIENLNKQITEKDGQIAALKDELSKMNIKVEDLSSQVTTLNTNVTNLTSENKEKQKVIEEKTAELNSAYYIIGTVKELKDKNIIKREGFLGTAKDVNSNIDKSLMTKVDITTVQTIPIKKKKATIISTHPATSYKIEGDNSADNLVILNPAEFWSLSKVLVISVK
jgi:chromosome segregation ATPase